MFVCSVCQRWWSVHTLLSLWVVVEQVPPPWSRLRELMLCDHSDPLLSVCCGGHSLWSRINLEAALFFLPYSEHNKGLYVIFSNWPRTQLPIGCWLFALLLHGKRIIHLFNYVALLFLSYAVNGSEGLQCGCGQAWCWARLDQTVGESFGQKSMWKENQVLKVHIIHIFTIHSYHSCDLKTKIPVWMKKWWLKIDFKLLDSFYNKTSTCPASHSPVLHGCLPPLSSTLALARPTNLCKNLLGHPASSQTFLHRRRSTLFLGETGIVMATKLKLKLPTNPINCQASRQLCDSAIDRDRVFCSSALLLWCTDEWRCEQKFLCLYLSSAKGL